MRIKSVTAEIPRGGLWVPPGGVRTGTEGSTIFTTGVGACIELAIHDPRSKIGHMAHIFSTRGSQQAAFSQLETVLELHGTDPSQLSGWMTGGSSEACLSRETGLRAEATERLTALGLHPDINLSVEWNDDESMLLAASLECATGTHAVAARPIIRSA